MTTLDNMFELGIELRDNGELKHAVKVFSKILVDFPNDKKCIGVYAVLGGVHLDLEEYDNALINFKKATELNPKSELASMGLYVSLVELNRNEEGVKELIRYLKNFPAKLYKGTLEELLEGLEEGYMTDYEDDIRNFARANGVEI